MPKKPPIKLDKPKQIIPAFTVVRVEGGWSYVRIELDQDFNVLATEMSNPDMKPIITEKFRIEVGKYWGKLDEQVPVVFADN